MNSYIICSGNLERAYEKALDMAADLTGKREKVFSGNHPDVITCRKKDDKSEFTVDLMRQIVSDAAVMPNESDCKVYILYDGELMNREAQNAALKVLEEPPKGVYFILLTRRMSAFLQTIRSRCSEIYLSSDSEENEEAAEFAAGYLKTVAGGDALELWKFCEGNNKINIATCKTYCSAVQEAVADILCGRKDSIGLDTARLLEISGLMDKCLKYLEANVSPKSIMGLLEINS